jgi:predicted nucleic acid-binding protein
MTVVSDASPLHYLVLIKADHVLAQLFLEVVVPPAVLRELAHERAPEHVRRWASNPPQWLRVMGPANVRLDAKLGDGEAEAIGLALEIRAKTLLIDERDGTNVARRLGVATAGTLGVLILASAKNLLPLEQSFAALQQTSFRVRPSLLAALLAHEQHRRSQRS